ncbi:AraC-like DNA-binding protein [Streptomyces sp. 1114.5]|uniref:AraC family transcriptional regulator n=1 Tax=Streptomyces sp. 1114.5 TaxID=1938830 RepID=UPI000EAD89A3|nr:AraC family transcriptional regulator [Streptomyces sp. 1114.5]RKT11282.1 AraC-like DNA-binding protein [Streptomyces sp. 1114.5]
MSVQEESAIWRNGLSAKDRFEYWRELIGRTRVADATSAHADDFTAQARRLELGQVVLLGSSFPSARFRRTERMIRRSDQELYHLTLLTSGIHGLRRGRDQVETFGVGDLALIDSSTPHDVRMVHDRAAGGIGPEVAAVGIDLPASLLPVPPRRLRDLLGRRLSGREGTGALLADFLLGLDRQAAVLRPAEASRIGAVVLDLLSAWIAGELDAEHVLPEEARQRAKVESIRTFIRGHLHDPRLTPPMVAAAHHISVSHLHRLFARYFQGETVAGFIRCQRLGEAHRELADPALLALPVHAIGARCGIRNASDFSRAFKAAYGLSPREFRFRAHLTPKEETPSTGLETLRAVPR